MNIDNLWLPYCQMKTMNHPIHVVATEGNCLILDDGRRLIDGIASWWTACHGYNRPELQNAISAQLQQMPHVMLGGIVHEQATRLTNRLAKLAGHADGKVFLTDSGSVAVEVAMKIAVQYWRNREQPNHNRFICFQDSYHGDTVGAMSLCDPVDSMHHRFKGFLLEQYSHPIPNDESGFEKFESFVSKQAPLVAGVIIEPLIQMAAGMRFHSPESLRRICEICQSAGLLFIVDEIATGFARTGTMFAFEQAGIQPDLVCLGKALSGGTLSIAGTVASQQIYKAFHSDEFSHALMHGPTFMGNPLACAAANASLDLFENKPRLQQAAKLEALLKDRLNPLAKNEQVKEVRCLGAVGVIHLQNAVNVPSAIQYFIEHGAWIRPLRDVIYLTPPLTISPMEMEHLCDVIIKYVGSITAK